MTLAVHTVISTHRVQEQKERINLTLHLDKLSFPPPTPSLPHQTI